MNGLRRYGHLLFTFFLFAATGCSFAARHMVARPAFASSGLTEKSLPHVFQGRIVSVCVLPGPDSGPQTPCIYRTVFYDDSVIFASVTKEERDALAYYLLRAANDNCAAWMTRVYANRTTLDGFRDAIKSLMTGAAALTAKPSPGISAGLGFINLFADSTVKSIDANAYANQTFQAFRSAINKQRNDKQTEILDRLRTQVDTYPIGALLLDIGQYKDMCSLISGLESLQKITTTEEKLSEGSKSSAEQKLYHVQDGSLPPSPLMNAQPNAQPNPPPHPN